MFNIGGRIKQLRMKNDLTLAELASRTELTKGFLSQLERNLTSPSIQTLEDIAEALGVSMAQFFTEEKDEQVVFTKEDEFVDEQDGRTIHWIVPNAQKNAMEPVLLELEPGSASNVIEPHEGEEFGYVLSGRILLITDSDRHGKVVRKGENFYIHGGEAHRLKNPSGRNAVILWISTPPEF